MIITEKNTGRTVEIRMLIWQGERYSPDIAADFFQGATEVDDLDYCIDAARDWEQGKWEDDFYADLTDEEIAARTVVIRDLSSRRCRINENTRKALARRIANGDLYLGGPSVRIGDHYYDVLDGSGQVRPYILRDGCATGIDVADITGEDKA